MCDVAVDYNKYHDANISNSKYRKLSKIRNYEPSGASLSRYFLWIF